MKKTAVLVIASLAKPVYVHYVTGYWKRAAEYLGQCNLPIDVFLLFEHHCDLDSLQFPAECLIQEPYTDYEILCDSRFHNEISPGLLSKTVFALEQLEDHYDVFFRTNLSSFLKLERFNEYVQNEQNIEYSGPFVWTEALRDNLIQNQKVGPGRSIQSIDELSGFCGNSFASGCGFFLNRGEVNRLVSMKNHLRYDLPDDVAIGLALPGCKVLPDFCETISPNTSTVEIIYSALRSKNCHIRLEHFPARTAIEAWKVLESAEIWR